MIPSRRSLLSRFRSLAVVRTCKWESFCPFCYARRVVEIYKKVHDVCKEDYRTATPAISLIERYVTDPEICHLQFENETKIVEGLRTSIGGRRRMTDRFEAIGAYGIVHILPLSADPLGWSVNVRQLFLVPRGVHFEKRDREALSIHDKNLSAEIVCRAVANVCRYPKPLLSAPIERIRSLLELKRRYHLHLSGNLGLFRNNQNRVE